MKNALRVIGTGMLSLVALGSLAAAADYICTEEAGCNGSYVDRTTGTVVTVNFRRNTILSSEAGFIVNTGDGWNPYGS